MKRDGEFVLFVCLTINAYFHGSIGTLTTTKAFSATTQPSNTATSDVTTSGAPDTNQSAVATSPVSTANKSPVTTSPVSTANKSPVTTSPASTANKSPVTTSPASTTNQPGVTANPYRPTFLVAELQVSLSFKIKFSGADFNDTLLDNSFPLFKSMSSDYETQLTGAFNETIGFQSVTVIRFWPGSIGVDYEVKYNHSAVNQSDELKRQLKANVSINLQALPDVDQNYVRKFNDSVDEEIDMVKQISQNPCLNPKACPAFHTCKASDNTSVQCASQCNKDLCGSHGACQLNSSGDAVCRCHEDENYVYSGETCAEKTEKLDLSSDYIIAIAAGVGGGLIFILTIALVVTCFRRRRSRSDKEPDTDYQSNASFQSMSMKKGESALVQQGLSHITSPYDQLQKTEMTTFSARAGQGGPGEVNAAPSWTHLGETSAGGEGPDGRLYRVMKNSQIFPDAPMPGDESRVDRRPRERDTSGLFRRDSQQPQLRHSTAEIRNLYTADPSELSGFPREDKDPSSRRPGREAAPDYDDPWGSPRSSAWMRDQDPKPAGQMTRGDPAVWDFDDELPETRGGLRDARPRSFHDGPRDNAAGPWEPSARMTHVYDQILQEKILIQRPKFQVPLGVRPVK